MSLATTREHLDDIDRRVVAVEHDLGTCSACGDLLEEWSAWRNRWRSHLLELRATVDHSAQALSAAAVGGVFLQGAAESLASEVLADVDRDADGWAAELANWQRRAAARGASLTTPGAPPGVGLPWLTIAVVGVAVVGVGVGAWYWYGPKIRRNPCPRTGWDREDAWARGARDDVRFYENLRNSHDLNPDERAHLTQLRRELAAYKKRLAGRSCDD